MTILEHCHRSECTQVVDALQRRITELEAALKKQTEDYRYVFAERDRAWERIAELEAALEAALEAFETYFNQYPHMQKGYTLDAIEILKEVRRD